jgi:hypothetical protein
MHGMMGRRSEQRSLFTADSQYLEFVGRDSFYGFLAIHGPELFGDDEFADFYCHTVGRTSIPPSRLMIALILQTYDRVSDEEAKKRADFDLRWKVALGVELDDRPFAKSTLQEFRAQLLIHDKAQSILARTLELAKEQVRGAFVGCRTKVWWGYLPWRALLSRTSWMSSTCSWAMLSRRST